MDIWIKITLITIFSFLQDVRNEEIASLKQRVAALKVPGKKGQRQRQRLGITKDSMDEQKEKLKGLLHEKAEYERRQVDRASKRTVKKQLQQDVAAEGKHGVYFPKRKEMKRLHLEARFEELRKRGGDAAVDKVVAKR